MSAPTLWQRAKRTRIVQILAVYFGASWVVLQIADTLVDALNLPTWVIPVTIILLMVGLLVIAATAIVQSLPSTTAREEAGELPTDWQIAPRDALTSLRAGRMPHLTWGRAVMGGVIVLALLFGGAGIYMGATGGPRFGPAKASASEAAEGIAVVPFGVRGQDLEIWREGMMDLLSSGLDGVGGFRAIDSRTVMARWEEAVGSGRPDLESTLRVARGVGARYALVGSVVGLGTNVRLTATVHDLDTGKEVATGRAEGPVSDVLRLVDELAVGTMRSLLIALGRVTSGDESAETITTTSLPALRAYLEGETAYREGHFAAAVQSYERAVAADSTFAIALVRLAETYGWLESQNSERMLEVGEKANAQTHRLSPRYQFLMQGWDALNHGTADGVTPLKDAVRKYPDDPRAWFLLAETYIHVPNATYGTEEDLWEALQRATSLDPKFAPHWVHFAEEAVLRGDRAAAEEALARYKTLTGGLRDAEHIQLAIPLLLGTKEEVAAAYAAAAAAAPHTLDIYLGTFARRHDRFTRDAIVDSMFGARSGAPRTAFQAYHAAGAGQLARGASYLGSMTSANRGIYWAYAKTLWQVQPPAGVRSVDACTETGVSRICLVLAGASLADDGNWAEHGRILSRLRKEAAAARDTAPQRALLYTGDADVVEAAALWRRGDVVRARKMLEPVTRLTGNTGDQARIEFALLEVKEGRHAEALRHYRALLIGFNRPLALYGMATMHEALRQPEEARPYWDKLHVLTEEGDENIPRIAETRAVLARRLR